MTDRSSGAVVVTGAASGMGEAAVGLASDRFATVVAIDRDAQALERLSSSSAASADLRTYVCDITTADEVDAVADRVIREVGRIDALLNFAGVSDFGPAEATSAAIWDRQLAVNLTGTFLTCQAFGRAMIAQGAGAIVNVASTAGTFGVPAMAAYSASKHGVVGLTRALAVEWGRHGIRVNCICPGATLTPMLLGTSEEFRAARTRRIPLGRLGEPAEQAAVALFLASAESAYVTGAILPVDGGVAAMAPGTSEAAIGGAG